jgi:hypothetical protein
VTDGVPSLEWARAGSGVSAIPAPAARATAALLTRRCGRGAVDVLTAVMATVLLFSMTAYRVS